VITGIEQLDALGAQRNVQPLLDGVQDDEVAQDVLFKRQQEGGPGALQAFNRLTRQKPIKRVPTRDRPSMIRLWWGVGGDSGLGVR